MYYFLLTHLLKGPSTWGKKVGRKWEQNKKAALHPSADSIPLMDDVATTLTKQQDDVLSSAEPTTPTTTPILLEDAFGQAEGVAPPVSSRKVLQQQPQHPQQQRYRPSAAVNNKASAKRRVSRVESLRNLFLRSSRPSAAAMTPVPLEPIQTQQEPPLPAVVASRPPVKILAAAPDVIQEAQQKNMLVRGGSGRLLQPNRSISLENVSAGLGVMETPDVTDGVATKKSHFPYSFIRSRLNRPLTSSCETASIPQAKSGELASASCDDLMTETTRQSHPDLQLASIRYRSVVSVSQEDGPFKLVRRKRSFSLAALPISASEATQTSSSSSSSSTNSRSEESGYESDSTRNGSESPRRTSADSGKTDASSIHVSFVSSLKSVDEPDHSPSRVSRQTAISPTPLKNRLSHESTPDRFSLVEDLEAAKKQQNAPPQHRCCSCRCQNNLQPDNSNALKQQNSRKDLLIGAGPRTVETGTARSRHLPVIGDAIQAGRYARSSSLDRNKWLQSSVLVEFNGNINDSESLLLDRQTYSTMSAAASSLPPGLAGQPLSHPPRPSSSFAYAPLYHHQQPQQQQQQQQQAPHQPRQFKMLRLVKGDTGELGIYIKKKPSPDSGSVGYVIAGIEPGALAHRQVL